MLGRVKTVGFPLGFSRAQPEIRSMALELGQHTEEVLLEASYSWEEISGLRGSGAI